MFYDVTEAAVEPVRSPFYAIFPGDGGSFVIVIGGLNTENIPSNSLHRPGEGYGDIRSRARGVAR